MSPVRPSDQREGLKGPAAAIASHLVGVAFDGVGLNGLEPLTSALSGGVIKPEMGSRHRVCVHGNPSLLAGAMRRKAPSLALTKPDDLLTTRRFTPADQSMPLAGLVPYC
jgi:hypothetical protein